MNTLNQAHTIIGSSTKSGIPDANMRIDSNALFKNGDVVLILHRGEQYSLRRTRNGKLILNK
ncbi:MAG: hemin uptake protein HemP [Gammaproteobacteria bacterium]|nr:hemin uptake protein HemP [Pseudomonadota bacterium]QOJ24494.1 MAG: hemin uptake protein HemP [Gammaproteobacteria bacterium]